MKSRMLGLSAALLFAALPATSTFAQLGSDFTYQGKLELSGDLVNGTADFQFRLFNSSGGNVQIGSTQNLNNVSLLDGLFTVPINFGPDAFDGNERYLEIAVRSPAGGGSFVVLNPRQKLTAAPYAQYAQFSAKPWRTTGADIFYNLGNVGIGTSAPSGKLEVRAGNNSYVRVDSTNGDLHMNGGSDVVAGICNDSTGANARLDFVVNNGAQMVVNGAGNVGVGLTAPPRRFTVADNNLWTARFQNSHPIASVVEFYNSAADSLWELGVGGPQITFGMQPGSLYFFQANDPFGPPMVIAPNHWVGLGSPNPGFRLELPNIGSQDGRGRANAWVTYSSARWKDNVQTLDHALDTIKQLRGVSFDWKAEHGGQHDIGFVAEEVGHIVPEIVSWEKDGVWAQGLAYDRITALAVEAIKEQQTQIESLQAANAELREQIEHVMQLVEAKDMKSGAEVK